jgi:hypothetical protein
MCRPITLEEFLTKANKVYGSKYNYDRVVIRSKRITVTIICEKHGEFYQTPECHLRGSGCPGCRKDKSDQEAKENAENFIKRSKIIHKNRYDYSHVKYVNICTKVLIGCNTHGLFEQMPYSHLRNNGCKRCRVKGGRYKRIKLEPDQTYLESDQTYLESDQTYLESDQAYLEPDPVDSRTLIDIIGPIDPDSFNTELLTVDDSTMFESGSEIGSECEIGSEYELGSETGSETLSDFEDLELDEIDIRILNDFVDS